MTPAEIVAVLEQQFGGRLKAKNLTHGQPLQVPIPSRTGYTLLPPELSDPDPVKAMEKQNAFAKDTKEKAAPAQA